MPTDTDTAPAKPILLHSAQTAAPITTTDQGDTRLEQIAAILKVPVTFFHQPYHDAQWRSEPDIDRLKPFLETPAAKKLIEFFVRIEDVEQRQRMIALILSIACFTPPVRN